MNFEVFKEILKNNIAVKLGNEYDVVFKDVIKNNGVMLTGVSILKKGTDIASVIYINEYYDMYKSGKKAIYTIVDDIIRLYKKNMPEKSVHDARFFLNFDTVQPRIIHKVINTEKNQELLKDVPHIDFLDLSIIFQIMLPNDDHFGTIMIRNEHCKIWEIGIDELVFAARRNTPKLLPNVCRNLEFLIEDIIKEDNKEEIDSDFMRGESVTGVLILSNDRFTNGASVILDKNFLRECSDRMNSSYYILPSSIHEVLAIPDDGLINTADLKDMVKTVNDTEVNEEEILSYSVYYFDMVNDRLSVL